MFLTKKGLWSVLIMAICYFIVGSFCFATGTALAASDAKSGLLFGLGVFSYVCCLLRIVFGILSEGTGKILYSANKLIRTELKPSEFIQVYQGLRSRTDQVVNKPGIEVLQLVTVAYYLLGDRENCLSAVDEMIAAASEKKKALAKLSKASFLFSYNMNEEAEALFAEARASKQSSMCQALADGILKSDRAIAMGDYKTAEAYNLKMLAQTFPKQDNLSKLVRHFTLGEIYEKSKNYEKAIPHYTYCVEYGGETAIKEKAESALEKMQ